MARERTESGNDIPFTPPDDIPADPALFWAVAVDLDALSLPSPAECRPALERLGPPPFPRSGFPLLGFLATIYEHVSDRSGEALAHFRPHSQRANRRQCS